MWAAKHPAKFIWLEWWCFVWNHPHSLKEKITEDFSIENWITTSPISLSPSRLGATQVLYGYPDISSTSGGENMEDLCLSKEWTPWAGQGSLFHTNNHQIHAARFHLHFAFLTQSSVLIFSNQHRNKQLLKAWTSNIGKSYFSFKDIIWNISVII